MRGDSWQARIFSEGEIIGYKKEVEGPVTAFADSFTQFYIVNPVRNVYSQKPGSIENLTRYKNIVVEFDALGPKAQLNFVKKVELPYAMATFSGNKSIHFIISCSDGFSSLDEYTWYARAVYYVLGGSPDPKCKNPNRLTRVPNALRRLDDGSEVEQTYLEGGARVRKAELHNWLLTQPLVRNKFQKFLRAEEEQERLNAERQARVEASGPTPIPKIYQDMLKDGVPHPDAPGRHDSLVKFGAWLIHNGYDDSDLETYIQQAADSLGIGHRSDAPDIIKYYQRRAR